MGRRKRRFLPVLLITALTAGNAAVAVSAAGADYAAAVQSPAEQPGTTFGGYTPPAAGVNTDTVSGGQAAGDTPQGADSAQNHVSLPDAAGEAEYGGSPGAEQIPGTGDETDISREEDGQQPGNEESSSVHHHDAACGYIEAQPEIPCDHKCVETDKDGSIIHCPECAYRPAVEESPCQYELELKRQQEEELRKQQENQDSNPEESENQKKEDELEKELKEEENKDTDIDTNGTSDSLQGENKEASANPAGQDDKEPVEVPDNEAEGTSDDIQAEVTGLETSESDKASAAESDERSNEPSYEVEIPSQVMLIENMNSFDIKTRRLCQEEAGSLLVTVEGTQSPDGENFALYCGEESWEYQLEMAGNILTPKKNQTILEACDGTQRVNVIPQENINLMAGSYTGVLTFRVVYESNVGK